MRLHILGAAPAELIEAVHSRFPEVSVSSGEDPPAEAEAILVWGMREHLVSSALAQCPSARWLHLRRAGISETMLDAMRQFPHVVFTNGRGGRGRAVAEYAATVLLALLKGLPELQARQARREWARDFTMIEASALTVAVLGLGDVGLNAARMLRALGMRVIGIRRQGPACFEVDETHDYRALAEVLPRVNALIIAAPFTPETERIAGRRELALLPRGSYVVNVGRGELLDTGALIEALRSGHVAGAALDVFDTEPLPSSSPLWELPNVIISPHAASHTTQSDERGIEVFLENLGRFVRGEPLLNVVDAARGY